MCMWGGLVPVIYHFNQWANLLHWQRFQITELSSPLKPFNTFLSSLTHLSSFFTFCANHCAFISALFLSSFLIYQSTPPSLSLWDSHGICLLSCSLATQFNSACGPQDYKQKHTHARSQSGLEALKNQPNSFGICGIFTHTVLGHPWTHTGTHVHTLQLVASQCNREGFNMCHLHTFLHFCDSIDSQLPWREGLKTTCYS